ncbi:hypothetical protein A7D35_20370 [Xanthomonas arboricola]|uniref:DUF2213 domain-containing protein n=1 Tax=Xanthomonas arboricola TaxID=56448 RepID=UPI0007ED0930|nr:DUF2213 domain-containing protein [Xanthomonas arboricola]OBR70619.1 hypothetical protein A7D35_20370 [Xanthomonas arboricola]
MTTQAIFTDRITVGAARRTADGYLVADAKVARTGVQEYMGHELGRPDLPVVRVYRPADEVFSDATLRSFAHRPMTLEHPRQGQVDASNWKQLAIGHTGSEVVRDGDFVRVPLVLMDSAAITAYESGKRELSMGYSAEIHFEAGTAPDGQHYDAVQRKIANNHCALTDTARGGRELHIDSAQHSAVPVLDAATFRKQLSDGGTTSLTDHELDMLSQQLAANAAAAHRPPTMVRSAPVRDAAAGPSLSEIAYSEMCDRLQRGARG